MAYKQTCMDRYAECTARLFINHACKLWWIFFASFMLMGYLSAKFFIDETAKFNLGGAWTVQGQKDSDLYQAFMEFRVDIGEKNDEKEQELNPVEEWVPYFTERGQVIQLIVQKFTDRSYETFDNLLHEDDLQKVKKFERDMMNLAITYKSQTGVDSKDKMQYEDKTVTFHDFARRHIGNEVDGDPLVRYDVFAMSDSATNQAFPGVAIQAQQMSSQAQQMRSQAQQMRSQMRSQAH